MDEKFRKMIAEELKIEDLESITRESSFDSLGIDSLGEVELVLKIDQNYNVFVPEDYHPSNLGELYDYVQDHINKD